MTSLDNYIYYSICEESLVFAKKTHYLTYRTYCISIKNLMSLEKLGHREYTMIYNVSEKLELIYGLSLEESIEYICNYFSNELYIEYELPVKMIQECFTNSFN